MNVLTNGLYCGSRIKAGTLLIGREFWGNFGRDSDESVEVLLDFAPLWDNLLGKGINSRILSLK